MPNSNENFAAALATFVEHCQGMINDHYEQDLPNLVADVLSIDPRGKKYARIVVSSAPGHGSSRSVYCFVNKENGDVLKAAGWKAPAKHARGTIYGPPEGYGVTVYGGQYIG